MNSDLKQLLEIGDAVIAEDIQRILEESGIHSLLESDHPAASAMNVYAGQPPAQNVTIMVHRDAHANAVEILENSPYRELISDKNPSASGTNQDQ